MINELKENEIFVAGTNSLGNHGAGAARQAYEQFGLDWGFDEGLCDRTYAFPTLDENMEQFSHVMMTRHRAAFYRCARANPDLTFLLTPVGTGIAGYDPAYIKDLFKDTPANVVKVGWE